MLAIETLRKTFNARGGGRVHAVDGVSLAVDQGKLLTLLGPSGCGKTTILRCIAGLERPDSGRIVIGNQTVYDSDAGIFVPANRRGIGMVFQSYAIWPHMSVFENVAFPLRVARGERYGREEVAAKVKRALEMVRLGGFETRSATQLSGGQQQRLALARGLVREPALLLLDEPLSNLDAKLREQMRFELKRLQTELGVTTLYVTHDQSEALALSDVIAVFNAGQAIQSGSPFEIYRNPNSEFVADFTGSTNFLEGTADAGGDGDGASVSTPFGVMRCGFVQDGVVAGGATLVSIRPEDAALSLEPPPAGVNTLLGTVSNRIYLGDVFDYQVSAGGTELRVRMRAESGADFPLGAAVHVSMPVETCVALRKPDSGERAARAQADD
ncbi:MAG: ATP-binding cassette domain-containing protein [Alphaproteobacteria bacterium]|nr:ATP-binding cassette domain-containing protein [Alphaproteobacteria bacterium]